MERRREGRKRIFTVAHRLWTLQVVNAQICLPLFAYEKSSHVSNFSHKSSFKAQEHKHRE